MAKQKQSRASKQASKQASKANLDDIPELDGTRAKVIRRGPKDPLGPRMSLRSVREAAAKTQVEIARAAEMDQGDVSRLEQRDDVRLSTLRRYLRALGADVELVAVFGKTGHRMRLDL